MTLSINVEDLRKKIKNIYGAHIYVKRNIHSTQEKILKIRINYSEMILRINFFVKIIIKFSN